MRKETLEKIIMQCGEVQRRNPPTSAAWQDAHDILRDAVIELYGVDIDGAASHRGGLKNDSLKLKGKLP